MAWENDGEAEPMIYGTPVEEYLNDSSGFSSSPTNRDFYKSEMYDGILPVLVIYLDGTRKEYN